MALFCGDFLIENKVDLKTYGCFLSDSQKKYAREYLNESKEEKYKSKNNNNNDKPRCSIHEFGCCDAGDCGFIGY